MAGISLRVLSLIVCLLHGCTATLEPCSGSAEECEGSSGAALLQMKNKIHQHVAADLSEDAESEQAEASAVTSVQARLSKDGRTATVSFSYNGKRHGYLMTAQSLYSKDGAVTKHYAKGRQLQKTGRDLSVRQFFRVHSATQHALAFVHGDGTVRGTFKQHGDVVRVEPSPSAKAPVNLMEVQSTGREHLLSRVDFANGVNQVDKKEGRVREPTPVPEPPYSGLSQVGESAKGEKKEPAIMECYSNATLPFYGDPFFPGCYPGDSKMHEMEIRLVLDVAACEKAEYGPNCDGAKDRAEQFIVDSNFILEGQINMRYVIKTLDQYFDRATAPSYGGSDCAGNNPLESILYAARAASANTGHAFMQVLTGCGTLHSFPTGIGYVGKLCDDDYGVSVSILARDYLNFLRNSGHMLGASAVQNTGGIMDFPSDGYLHGVVQFNYEHSRNEICDGLWGISPGWGSGCSNWKEATAAPAPAPAPAPATPAPTPAPTTTDVSDACFSDSEWVDTYGDGCSDYDSHPHWCDNAHTWAVNGVSAADVCCICGGSILGSGGAPAPTTSAPTTSSAGRSGGDCTDNAAWVDSYGDGCSDYDSHPSWCDSAETWAVGGVSAKDACCVCGGGM